MESKELRIGNYIKIQGQNPDFDRETIIIEICALGSGHVGVPVFGMHKAPIAKLIYTLESIHPILLTEEWLLKFGFTHEDHNLYVNAWTNKVVNLSEEFEILHPEPNYDYEGNGFKIKFVHQLQNLYFALTGEELTIKQ